MDSTSERKSSTLSEQSETLSSQSFSSQSFINTISHLVIPTDIDNIINSQMFM